MLHVVEHDFLRDLPCSPGARPAVLAALRAWIVATLEKGERSCERVGCWSKGGAHHAAAGGAVLLHAAAANHVNCATVVSGPFKLRGALAVGVNKV